MIGSLTQTCSPFIEGAGRLLGLGLRLASGGSLSCDRGGMERPGNTPPTPPPTPPPPPPPPKGQMTGSGSRKECNLRGQTGT